MPVAATTRPGPASFRKLIAAGFTGTAAAALAGTDIDCSLLYWQALILVHNCDHEASRRRSSALRLLPSRADAGDQHSIRNLHAAERPEGRPVDRSNDTDRGGEHLLSRRFEERIAGTHRFCPPLRARHVHRIRARRVRAARSI